jgi:hypothetical protein
MKSKDGVMYKLFSGIAAAAALIALAAPVPSLAVELDDIEEFDCRDYPRPVLRETVVVHPRPMVRETIVVERRPIIRETVVVDQRPIVEVGSSIAVSISDRHGTPVQRPGSFV